MLHSLARAVRALTRTCGVDIVRYMPPAPPAAASLELPAPEAEWSWAGWQRHQLMQQAGIDLLFDVGANVGQFGREVRHFGFNGDIFSFEPMAAAYQKLAASAAADPRRQTFNFAFGEHAGPATINLAANSYSSSLLPMAAALADSTPQALYVGHEEIQVRTLDDFWGEHAAAYAGRRIMLKIDTQGFEKFVLAGAKTFLPHVHLVQVEMSLLELYNGEMLWREMMDYLAALGFSTVLSLTPGHYNVDTGQLLECDGLFGR